MTYVRPVSCTATAQEQYQIFKFKNRYERVRFIYRTYLATQHVYLNSKCVREGSDIGPVQVIDVFTLRVFQWMVILWRPGLEKVGEEMKQEMVWAGNSSPLLRLPQFCH